MPAMQRNRLRWAFVLLAVLFPAMIASLWMVFAYAPVERVMGPVQKIFYYHVPSAIVTFLSVGVLMVASIGYLWTGRAAFDRVGRAAAEIGMLFCTLVLVTGPIWAKPAWGTWWTWEARLTTTLILWLLLASCIMVRNHAQDRALGARLASVLGIVAALDVPIIYKAVEWWRGLHPKVFGPDAKDPLEPAMLQTFLYCMAVFVVLYAVLMIVRVELARLEDRSTEMLESLSEEMP